MAKLSRCGETAVAKVLTPCEGHANAKEEKEL